MAPGFEARSGLAAPGPRLTLAAALLAACAGDAPDASPARVFVAAERAGRVVVIDARAAAQIAEVDLTEMRPEGPTGFRPHNVQVAPDGRSVWVTAASTAFYTSGYAGRDLEEVIVLDPLTLRVRARVELTGVLAHVVLDPDSRYAYVTATLADRVYRIDAQTFTLAGTTVLGLRKGPHGARFCRGRLWVANGGAHSVSVIDPARGVVGEVPIGGVAMQTACVADRWVFASSFSAREVVRIDPGDLSVTHVPLPDARGPLQLYAAPDGRRLYVCDQGALTGTHVGNRLFEVDPERASVAASIEVGLGAHGVVVDADGAYAWVTGAADNNLSRVELATRRVTAVIQTAAFPNGVSWWSPGRGMP